MEMDDESFQRHKQDALTELVGRYFDEEGDLVNVSEDVLNFEDNNDINDGSALIRHCEKKNNMRVQTYEAVIVRI